jgi:adenylate cyclase, class 2
MSLFLSDRAVTLSLRSSPVSKSEQEIEVKFLVRDLSTIMDRLLALGASIKNARVLETNLRFDTPDGILSRSYQVLRLRQDAVSRLTYKGPAVQGMDVSSRLELEFTVSDFQAARRFLEALGYQVSVIYEKYRAEYVLGELVVTLDEMPYGNFIEIEGPDVDSIRQATADLRLDWEARSTSSYIGLFYQLRNDRNIPAQNLTFAEFQGVQVSVEDLGLRYAA